MTSTISLNSVVPVEGYEIVSAPLGDFGIDITVQSHGTVVEVDGAVEHLDGGPVNLRMTRQQAMRLARILTEAVVAGEKGEPEWRRGDAI